MQATRRKSHRRAEIIIIIVMMIIAVIFMLPYIWMLLDSFKEDEDQKSINPRDLRSQLLLAVATSIDALAVGISYACTGYDTFAQLSIPLLYIGLVSFGMSLLGFWLGARFGDSVNRKMRPELLGGLILIGIGIKVLLEHLLG